MNILFKQNIIFQWIYIHQFCTPLTRPFVIKHVCFRFSPSLKVLNIVFFDLLRDRSNHFQYQPFFNFPSHRAFTVKIDEYYSVVCSTDSTVRFCALLTSEICIDSKFDY